jgi:signal transduction histidine kinase
MRTLALLGSGIAHQLRNSATGCNIALDLLAQEFPLCHESDSLAVAKRQLELMEQYLQRFLQLGKRPVAELDELVDVEALVEDVLPLISPAARHAGIEVRWTSDGLCTRVVGNSQLLRQVLVNLLMNGIEAASQGLADRNDVGFVSIEISHPLPSSLSLTISDTGPGPASHVQNELFEPFVTTKLEGVGLGLAVAHDIIEQHHGRIQWQRFDGITRFNVQLPCQISEQESVHAVSG